MSKIATFGPKTDQNRHFFNNFENTQKSPLFWWRIAPNFRSPGGPKNRHFGVKSPRLEPLDIIFENKILVKGETQLPVYLFSAAVFLKKRFSRYS